MRDSVSDAFVSRLKAIKKPRSIDHITLRIVLQGRCIFQRTVKPAENLGMYYSQLIPVLIKVMQEQQSLIEQQAEKIKELEARLTKVE